MVEGGRVLWHNRFFYYGFPRAQVLRMGHIVSLVIDTPTPLPIRPGQYINVCIPGVSSWSFIQSHPFYICFARVYGRGTRLELIIEPRRGWTSKLLVQAGGPRLTDEYHPNDAYRTLFSGPHGQSINVGDYGTVFMIASGWGLTAHMPYLQALIYGFRKGTVKARRIHLVWQIDRTGKNPQHIERTIRLTMRS